MSPVIFVSACLLGLPVRYDGRKSADPSEILAKFVSRGGRIVTLCPECSGGLPTPRTPCEISRGSGDDVLSGASRVTAKDGADRTFEYLTGGREALALCLQNRVKVAVLKSSSPSCGAVQIYDGTFSGTKKPGRGVTAALLSGAGIRVYDETRILEAVSDALSEETDGSSCGCGA